MSIALSLSMRKTAKTIYFLFFLSDFFFSSSWWVFLLLSSSIPPPLSLRLGCKWHLVMRSPFIEWTCVWDRGTNWAVVQGLRLGARRTFTKCLMNRENSVLSVFRAHFFTFFLHENVCSSFLEQKPSVRIERSGKQRKTVSALRTWSYCHGFLSKPSTMGVSQIWQSHLFKAALGWSTTTFLFVSTLIKRKLSSQKSLKKDKIVIWWWENEQIKGHDLIRFCRHRQNWRD